MPLKTIFAAESGSRFAGPLPFAAQPDFGGLILRGVETKRRSPLALLRIPGATIDGDFGQERFRPRSFTRRSSW
jgi:hypothetical protein